MTSRSALRLVKKKGIYRRQPPYHKFSAIRLELQGNISVCRAVDMEALDGYAEFIRCEGHTAFINIVCGAEIMNVCIKALTHIHVQNNKTGIFLSDVQFDYIEVDMKGLEFSCSYYAGFIYVP